MESSLLRGQRLLVDGRLALGWGFEGKDRAHARSHGNSSQADFLEPQAVSPTFLVSRVVSHPWILKRRFQNRFFSESGFVKTAYFALEVLLNVLDGRMRFAYNSQWL